MNIPDDVWNHLLWKRDFYKEILLRPLEAPSSTNHTDHFLWIKTRYDELVEVITEIEKENK